ncbi:PAS domain S-box protein [Thermodesulfobacteriota bacterium]
MKKKQTCEELEQRIKALENQVSKEKLIETELREAYEFNERVLSSAPMGIGTYRFDGQCVSCNEFLGVIIGATMDQVLSQNFRELESWKTTGLLDVAEEVLSTGVVRALDIKTEATFGKPVWLECCLSRFKSAGEFHLLLMVNDITERKQAEAAMRASENRYRAVLEASPDPIVVYDMAGRNIYANPSFTRVFGWEMEELLGKKIDFVPEENQSETQKMINKVLAGANFSGIETRRYTKEGKAIDVSISAAGFQDSYDIPQGRIVILRDITEKKKLESHLRQAQKMQAVGLLAAGVAHEINNPLTSILTTVMLLQEDMDTQDPSYPELQLVTNETLRCRNIVTSLLDFSRGSKPIRKDNNISDMIGSSIFLTKKQAEFKDVAVEYDDPDEVIFLNVDKRQIEQALINIVLNAIEATEPGGKIVFDVRFSPIRDSVEILITDNGIGISEDDLDNIFDPFFTTKEDGNGLGLSITQGIIEQHGGTIDIESTPGSGTTFLIRLPLR